MNQDTLFDAFGEIRDDYILSARQRLEAAPKHKKNIRRMVLAAAAAAAVMASAFTAAMAASPEFRQAVFTLFHIGEAEQVPGPGGASSGVPDVSQGEIGGLVKAQYVRMDDYFTEWGDGLFCRYAEDEELHVNWPSEFWTVGDGQAVPTEVALDRREVSVDWRGNTYGAVFDWLEWNGKIKLHSLSRDGATEDEGVPLSMDVNPIPGRTDKVLLTLRYDTQMSGSCWYMLYDLASGQTEDFLADTGAERLTRDDRLHDALWARDMSGAILTCGWPAEGDTAYYLNLKTGEMADIGALTGVEGASAVFADDRTLLLFQMEWTEDRGNTDVTCWAYDLDSGTLTRTLEKTPLYRGTDEGPWGAELMGDHQKFCQVTEKDGRTRLVDLTCGEPLEIEGFTFDPDGGFLASPDGTKLLYHVWKKDGASEGRFSQLGVIDLEAKTFITFDRELPDGVKDSEIFWMDADRVVIRCRNGDSGHWDEQGLYIYEF